MRGEHMVSHDLRSWAPNILTSLYAERDAMGDDEYHPISKSGSNLTDSSVGYAIIDAIDTMQVMGLQEEYNRAREWISSNLSFDSDGNFNTFEVSTYVYRKFTIWANSMASIDHDSCPRWPSFSISPF